MDPSERGFPKHNGHVKIHVIDDGLRVELLNLMNFCDLSATLYQIIINILELPFGLFRLYNIYERHYKSSLAKFANSDLSPFSRVICANIGWSLIRSIK